jgi:predicted dehydrogenase
MAGKMLKVGVVGLGIGRWHGQNFASHPRCEVVACCDLNDHLVNITVEKHNLPVENGYRDYRKMFADAKRTGLEAISIALPNKFHAPVAVAAFKAGLHVLVEKPMAMSAAEARHMQAAAGTAGKTLMVNFSYRFEAESRAMKRIVESGELGEIYFGRTVWHRRRGWPGMGLGSWFATKAMSGGGPLMDLGVHRLDLAMWLMGNPHPVSVSASAFDHLGKAQAKADGKEFDVEDLGCALIRFDNGATLLLEASWACNSDKTEEMLTQLYGTQGGIVQRNIDGTEQFELHVMGESHGTRWTREIDAVTEPAPKSFHEFVDACLEGREPLVTAQHGINVQVVLDAIYKSAATGKEVRIVGK